MKHYIAIDWGATSGRVMVAHTDDSHKDGRTEMEEVHRFPNAIHRAEDGHFYWDFTGLMRETMEGLRKAAALGYHYESVGVDTWGVDVVFFDGEGRMLSEPIAYRDPYTAGIPEEFFEHLSADELYRRCGIQVLNFNTVFQLYACRKERFAPLAQAKHILFIPDAVSYLLSGRMVCEYSALSTAAMMDPRTKEIDTEVLRVCGLSRDLFPEIVYPGEDLGPIPPIVATATGLNSDCRVVAVAGHDTGSAVAACPRVINGKRAAYLSCGTWSLMGIVTDEPVISEESCALNFTNEGGVEGTTRLLKNITGMWVLEQCRKEWAAEGKEYSYPELVAMAQAAKGKEEFLFNPDEPRFANPASMLNEIQNGRVMTDQEIIWAIYNSMAHRYGEVFRMLQRLAPWPVEVLYVIGGGVRNAYLLQLTEQAIGVPVVVGPSEATAIGNILVQSRRVHDEGSHIVQYAK